MTEGDLIGLPSTDGNVTRFNPPEWFMTACVEPVLLFLDEVDRATLEVRQGIFELGDSRKLNGHYLHPNTVIFSAINGGEHAAQYQVGEMDPAELDRWTVFDLEPTVEDWLAWAKDNVDSLIWDFVNQNHAHLEHTTDFEPNKVYPSRRSWKRLNDCLVAADMLETPAISMIHLVSGFVGMEAGVALQDFIKNYDRLVTPEDILDHGQIEKTSGFAINDHNALVDKMEAIKVFEGKLDNDQLTNLAKYFITLPSEIAMKLWTVLGNGDMDNAVNLHGLRIDGVSVSSYIVEMITGENVSK